MAKRPSRTQERQRLLQEAAAVNVPAYCDVIVIGGGASGLAAAITAAEAGASVVVLERDIECGRPILATGNGRCNFANLNLDPNRYNDSQFVASVCGDSWIGDVLDFFAQSGLRWCKEDDRLYPMSLQASSVRNVLLARARDAGVVLAPAREVLDVEFISQEESSCDWVFSSQNACHYDPLTSTVMPAGLAEVGHLTPLGESGSRLLPSARAIILASGRTSFPSVANLGIPTARRSPVLCPIACEESPLSILDGRRARVLASLTKAGSSSPSWSEPGEVLFRSYGLSGIVALNLSRRAHAGDLVELDLAPELSHDDLRCLVGPDNASYRDGSLDGVLDPIIARTLEVLAKRRWHVNWQGREVGTSEKKALVALVKALPFIVMGPAEVVKAQVMRGGLSNSAFDPRTLSCHEHPWLFACGEALDVDGDCGGFNLAWAWKSGMVAGSSAARWALS